MNPELSSSFCFACSNLKRAFCVEWLGEIPIVACSENY